jgi:2-amino-4-hydroxy-6-hydroxymethyldihydropteridine diphosphokinase
MNTGIYILLGTNLGDRQGNITIAKQHISRLIGPIITESAIYKTSAWGNTNQPEFYNQVIEIQTTLSPHVALSAFLDIEQKMGRVRSEKWGERIMDIDILFWQDQVIKNDTLQVPHPGIPVRKFTLVPLAEITPGFIHPQHKKTIATLLEECTDDLPVEKLKFL